jgi:hypothetical protein
MRERVREARGIEYFFWIPVLLAGFPPFLVVDQLDLHPLMLLPFLIVFATVCSYLAYRILMWATGVDLLARQQSSRQGDADDEG